MDFKTVEKFASCEIIEKKSRFIVYVDKISCEDDAICFINKIKTKHWDASHNVFAYMLWDNIIQRYSDDGEPSGTAGIPVLEVIKKEGIFNVVIVVTRYFGGTLLGAGGLVRAYTNAAKNGILAAGILNMILSVKAQIICEYTVWNKLQNDVALNGGIVSNIIYENNVAAEVYVPKDIWSIFQKNIINAANGRVEIKIISEEFTEFA